MYSYPLIPNYKPHEIADLQVQYPLCSFQRFDDLLTRYQFSELKTTLKNIGDWSSPYQAADYLAEFFYFKGAEILNKPQENKAREIYALLPESDRCMLSMLFVMATYFSSKEESQLTELLRLFYGNIEVYMSFGKEFPAYTPLCFPNNKTFSTPFAAVHFLRDYLIQLNELNFDQRVRLYVSFGSNSSYLDYNAIKTSLPDRIQYPENWKSDLQRILQTAGYRLSESSYVFAIIPNSNLGVQLSTYALDVAMLGKSSLTLRPTSIRACQELMPQLKNASIRSGTVATKQNCCCIIS